LLRSNSTRVHGAASSERSLERVLHVLPPSLVSSRTRRLGEPPAR
jgi:hypothetical protein